ncbi:ABC transporter ATP-binding protein [bacterium]|jgi:ABC-2 type transport system ATP-binding protein|nr:ABC transporter ATP-binding protein [Verrucomicrobiales bacterium]MDC3255481.1 ABC transporter ATP-binding protein [bacterium]MDF1784958.1 ABC transporter ATP-binding protein [Verrucomicrobiales bacterium]
MITVENLSKHFGPKVAVKNLSFELKKGEVLGFLGPNGAGKSTTMRMITGYLPPTAGKITVGKADVVDSPVEAKAKIGYLPENAPLYSELTVQGFLNFIGELRGLSGADRDKAVSRSMDLCHLQGVRHQSVDTLSKGFRHRTCFAQALISDPEVLVMDEPTDGLDPNQKHEVRALIRRMGEEKAIIFSTHILEEVEAACSRAIIISGGEVVANGTPDQLKKKAKGAGQIRFQIAGIPASATKSDLEGLANVSSVDVNLEEENMLRGVVVPKEGQSARASEDIFKYVSSKNGLLQELAVLEGRLDDVFREITETSL